MKKLIYIITLLSSITLYPQPQKITPVKSVIVKTNVLGLVAKGPTFTIEKLLSADFSLEASFVKGQFNSILFTDHYAYSGLLLRAKKYLSSINPGELSPYCGVYLGNLHRNIETEGGIIGSNGYIGYPSRHFNAHSIRTGASLGVMLLTKHKIVLDGQVSVGAGRYVNLNKLDPNTRNSMYVDSQIWLSVGYCF